MSTLSPSQVISRSNSDLVTISMIIDAVHVDPDVRMQMILAAAQRWDRATQGTTQRHAAVKGARLRYERMAYPYVVEESE